MEFCIGVRDLKHIKFGVITLLLFGMVIVMIGIVCADQGVRAVPETQTLGTVTTAEVVGLTMETDAGAWTLTNDPDAMLVYTSSTGIEFLFQDAMLQQLVSNGGSYTKE